LDDEALFELGDLVAELEFLELLLRASMRRVRVVLDAVLNRGVGVADRDRGSWLDENRLFPCLFSLNLDQHVSVVSEEELMLETFLVVYITCLMKVIHVHLSDKRAIVIVLKKTWKHF
jgi:hypothetical protein